MVCEELVMMLLLFLDLRDATWIICQYGQNEQGMEMKVRTDSSFAGSHELRREWDRNHCRESSF